MFRLTPGKLIPLFLPCFVHPGNFDVGKLLHGGGSSETNVDPCLMNPLPLMVLIKES